MKRRLEENVNPDKSGHYGFNTLSSPLHTPSGLSSVSQSSYVTNIKTTSDLSSSQSGLSNTMPASLPGIKTVKTITQGSTSAQHSGLHALQETQPHSARKHKTPVAQMAVSSAPTIVSNTHQQIQRLKVDDALSYLDLVKYKFGEKPQIYNDFLDIMKEFKSQSIDTPGVIERVSNLFTGHPELIVGFNTFLPPGYKIEVKSNDQGYSFQVQVSMPSSSPSVSTIVPTSSTPHTIGIATGPPSSVVVTSSKPISVSNTFVPHGNTSVTVPSTVVTVPPLSSPALPNKAGHYKTTVQTKPSVQIPTHVVTPQQEHVELPGAQQPTPQNQPVEFNHAINYVNKIKNRFQGQPEKYKRFLEILHTYQMEQRNLKEDGVSSTVQNIQGAKQLTEAEVYSQVAKLFENQEDLLAEFGQFLPDAISHQGNLQTRKCEELLGIAGKPSFGIKMSSHNSNSNSNSGDNISCVGVDSTENSGTKLTSPPLHTSPKDHSHLDTGQKATTKRPSSYSVQHSSTLPHPPHSPTKKIKLSSFKDVSLAEASKYGSLNDFAFFDKVRKALNNQDAYDNFLRCVILFNQAVISRVELVQLVTPFLGQFPELVKWFKEFLGQTESSSIHLGSINSPPLQSSEGVLYDPIVNNTSRPGRPTSENALNIDYSACKRIGASYCALPKNFVHPKCSGRNVLCREVLNDTWVSFPTWSEDSTFVTSRKTQYEEYIYRCEDERFELDVVLETNAATIRILEGIHKKLCRMSAEEIAKFRLDDCLGGASPTIHQGAIRRIYGDKAVDIIDGLKKNPSIAVPVVLRRLKAKEDEWREAQKGFNKIWREQNEKFYLKSLDHQGIYFKQNDIKALRSKSLFNEIETCYDERHEQADNNGDNVIQGPHMILYYRDKSVLDDATNLLIHHVKRQSNISKEDKQRIKQLLCHFLPDLFNHPRQELSEDERDDSNEKLSLNQKSKSSSGNGVNDNEDSKRNRKESAKTPIHAISNFADEAYTLFFGNGTWYLFLHLHQILCDRLSQMYEQANILSTDEAKNKHTRKDSTSVALRLKAKFEIEVEDYYPAFLDMVKNVLDGNMDSVSYEDTLREMFGIHAYKAFTLDKVVLNAVRQLQRLVGDEACIECVDLYHKENKRNGAGGLCSNAYKRESAEMAYQRKAEKYLVDENCFKIIIYKRDCRVTFELLDADRDEPEHDVKETEKWSAFVDRYAESQSIKKTDDEKNEDLDNKAIFLPRNIRLWHERVGNRKSDLQTTNSDDGQYKFNPNSYKMVFVVNQENFLYKQQAFLKARRSHLKLSKRLGDKFLIWHGKWASRHISKAQCDITQEWLMGKAPNTVPNQTVVLKDNPLDKPPYRPYNKYKVLKMDSKKEN